MTRQDCQNLMRNALNEYANAKQSGSVDRIKKAVNTIENTFICVSLFGVQGTEQLRQIILKEREVCNE